MPCDYSTYSPEWKKISRDIIQIRAGNRCELCFVDNGIEVYRPHKKYRDEFIYPWIHIGVYCGSIELVKKTKIVLTVHHIDSNKQNNDSLNLLALCQKCHLRLDLAKHVRNRKAKKVKGQLEFSGGGQE